jgi:hypothetical protein
MGQFGNQPDFATNDVKEIVPTDTISSATNLNSSVLYVGDNTGDVIILIPAGSVGPSVINSFSSPGFVGSGGTGYGDVVDENTDLIGGSGTGLDILYTAVNGQVVSITEIIDPGTGYLNGDLVTVDNGDENAVFRIVATPGLPTEAQAVVFKGVQAGGFLPVTVDYVLATKGAVSTTADSLIAAR